MCCNWSKVNSLKKSKPKKLKVRCCYITARTVLECTCCRIHRYVAAPKVRCGERVSLLQTLLGTKKLATFTWGGGASLSQTKPSLKDVLLFALWPLLAPTWQGRGRLYWRLYVYVPIVCCWEKMSGCTWHQDFTIILVWGTLFLLFLPFVDG